MKTRFIALAMAGCSSAFTAQAGQKPQKIQIPDSLPKLETSALIYLADQRRFLVASDQTDDDSSPWLFLMNEQGEMEGNPVVIEGAQSVADMESISQEGNLVYVMSSQGLTALGKEKRERNQFVRARREGRRLVLDAQMELRPSLLAALENSQDPVLRSLRGEFRKKLDVESHFISEGELFIGLKNPQPKDGVALILGLGSVQEVFRAGQVASARVWRQIDFRAFGNSNHTLSDMLLEGDRLRLCSTNSWGRGALWTYEIAGGRLVRHEEFSSRPEGVARDSRDAKLMLVFDKTWRTPLFTRRELP